MSTKAKALPEFPEPAAVRALLEAGLRRLHDRAATAEAQLWLQRVEALLEWIVVHPKLVEIRHEAARLLSDLRGEEVLEPPSNRKV